MELVLLIIELMVAVALIIAVLLQRSEGGALGIGGSGGGMGGFMTGRAAGNALTKLTAVLAAVFMATSLALAAISGRGGEAPRSVVEQPVESEGQGAPEAPAEPRAPLR